MKLKQILSLFLTAFLISIMVYTSSDLHTAKAGDPIFKTGRISLGGESFSIGMSLDKTLVQHAVRDFSSTMLINGIQDLL